MLTVGNVDGVIVVRGGGVLLASIRIDDAGQDSAASARRASVDVGDRVLGGLEEGGWYRNGSDEELEAKGEVGKEDQDMMSPKRSLFTTLGPRWTGVDGC